jgi:LacI family transcriptional regulator
MKPGYVTMADVAQRCGVSTMTVSLALRNHPKVTKNRRDTIQTTAREMGYIPNPMFQALAKQRKQKRLPETIVWLQNQSPERYRTSFRHRKIVEGAIAAAAEMGYKCEPILLGAAQWQNKQIEQVLKARGIRGLILGHSPENEFDIDIDWDRYALVAISGTFRAKEVHRVMNNLLYMVRLCLVELQKLGYKRIGLALTTESDDNAYKMASAAYAEYTLQQPLDQQVTPYIPAIPDNPSLAQWIKNSKIDALISFGWDRTLIEACGLAFPKDIGWAELSHIDTTGYVSGIPFQGELLGRVAIQKVIQLLQNNHYGLPARPEQTLINGIWSPGKTAAASMLSL